MYKEPHKQYHKGSNSIINTLVNFHQLTYKRLIFIHTMQYACVLHFVVMITLFFLTTFVVKYNEIHEHNYSRNCSKRDKQWLRNFHVELVRFSI